MRSRRKKNTERTARGLPHELRIMLHLTGATPADYKSRSELLWTFLLTALRKGLDENDIVAACLDNAYAGGSIFEHVKEKGGEDYAKAQLEHALNNIDLPAGEKVLIRLIDGNTHNEQRLIQQALVDKKCPVYMRARTLVQPIWGWEDVDGDGRQVLSAKFVKYNVSQLSDMVAHHAVRFQRYDKKEKKWRDTDPPKKHIDTIIDACHGPCPEVAGIITAPTMRPNGSLITEPGYDAKTKLWYKPSSDIELPAIGTTQADAETALNDLKDLIKECAFKPDSIDQAVALAAMMTVVLRGAFPVAPVFFFHKPEPGTGGSYLTKIISTIVLGREAVPLNASADPKEFVKELSAAAYEADPILNLNNLTFDLESSMLSQMATEGTVNIRPFGKNTETVRCNCRAMTTLVNGNNIRVVGELVRRSLTSRLDTGLERPETKSYTGDPLTSIKSNRGKYLAAALTIARVYLNSGKKVRVLRINGFEGWSRFVQEPLVALGVPDPVASQEDARARDPERGALAHRIAAIAKHFGGMSRFLATDILEKVTATGGNGRPAYPDLYEAFSTREKISSRSIGNQLSKDEGRVLNGSKIELIEKSAHGHIYRVVSSGISPDPNGDDRPF